MSINFLIKCSQNRKVLLHEHILGLVMLVFGLFEMVNIIHSYRGVDLCLA
jgi:hypothetical protein